MKILKIYLLLFVLSAFVFSSCKKDDEVTASKEEMITGSDSKSWQITGAEGMLLGEEYSAFKIDFYNNNKIYSGGQEIPQAWIPEEFDDIPTFPACAKDNIIVFKKDKTYEANEGAVSCNTPSEFLLTEGTWSLSEDQKVLILNDKSGAEIKYNLTTLTEQSIKGETSGSLAINGSAIDYTLTTTFTAK